MILGNPAMIEAYQAGIPANGKPVPDGAKMAKVHWVPKQNQFFPDATVPGDLLNVDFMQVFHDYTSHRPPPKTVARLRRRRPRY